MKKLLCVTGHVHKHLQPIKLQPSESWNQILDTLGPERSNCNVQFPTADKKLLNLYFSFHLKLFFFYCKKDKSKGKYFELFSNFFIGKLQ